MLDKLPAQLRHFILIVGGTFLGVMCKAIITANGVTGVHWATTAVLAVNTAIVTGVTSFMLLSLTPLTKQYGAFADTSGAPLYSAPVYNTPAPLASAPASASFNEGVPTV